MALIDAGNTSKRSKFYEPPVLNSYDSDYEHSLEHLLNVQRLVANADSEPMRFDQQRGIAGLEVA